MSSSWDSYDCGRIEPKSLFEHIFRCFSFDKIGQPELENGNRIIMPLSCLDVIQTLPVSFPLFFKVEGFVSDKTTHCGVLEFTAEEGFVHLPRWMMRSLGLEEGDDVVLRHAELSAGTCMKLQPHATAFVEVSDPKAVLERALRGYACLSKGDTFMVRYNGRDYYLDVLEVGPGGDAAVSLIDTDCSLEFAPPLDYVEPPRRAVVEREGAKELRPFAGVLSKSGGGSAAGMEEAKKDGGKDEEKEEFEAFTGKGRVLGGRWLGRVMPGDGGRSVVVRRGSFKDAVAEGKKKGIDEAGKVELKACSGRGGHVTGGPSSDEAAQTGVRSAAARGGPVVEEDGGKKKEFEAFAGTGRVVGGRWLGRVVASGGRPVPAVVRGSFKEALVEGKMFEKNEGGVEWKASKGRGILSAGEPSSDATGGPGLVEGKKIEEDEQKEESKASNGTGGLPSSNAAGGPVVEGKKIEKDIGGKGVFKAFSGSGHVLGGPSLGGAMAPENGGWSMVEVNKSKKVFKAFTGRAHVLGDPLFD